MPTALLADRALISVSGHDAEHLLQNLVTTDLDKLGHEEARPSALLSPQGKILFDFLVSRTPAGGLTLEVRDDSADDLARRLMLYRLRAKAEIGKPEPVGVRITWDEAGAMGLRDTRFPNGEVRRLYQAPAAAENLNGWNAFRIASGIPESGSDYQLGDAFPHDVLLDQTGGVGLRKGCYIGQEVVSRMHHRGTARRRVLMATSTSALPPQGTDIQSGGRSIGVMGSSVADKGLALVRIDKVKDAVDSGAAIEAAGVTLDLEIPAWATFAFPQPSASGEDG
jgi:folate-binding protein YgfZ